jgi:hypothetical protein
LGDESGTKAATDESISIGLIHIILGPTALSLQRQILNTITMPPKNLNFITGNKNKLTEVHAILGSHVELSNQSLDLPEIQGTIEEIASDKCRRAAGIVRWITTYIGLAG